jgi:putative addiction module killer protein
MQPRKRKVVHYTLGERDLFWEWLQGLPDIAGRVAIVKRIARLEGGNFGDHRSVGCGVWELRLHCGPGYRVYYGEDGSVVILLICGGDKKTQAKDIRKARMLWAEYRRRK